ncbi:MAG: hypothetical protein JXA92_01890 [candidate division Zixibacteria bacterium]|nr:hypothetical protein [candidate division Zixibacteria bacterium]
MSSNRREYFPPATIISLHFRKRAYQINFCKALALTIIFFVLTIFITVLFVDENKTTQLSTSPGYFIIPSKLLLQNNDAPVPGGSPYTPGSPLADNHDGFGGFEGYRAGRGARGVQAAVYRPSPHSDLEPYMDGLNPGSIKYEESFGFSELTYDDGIFDYGLPKRDINSDRVWQLPREPGQKLKPIKNEMMAIKLERIKHPKNAVGIRGEARLQVTIDDGGNILDCEVLYENPGGYGFAKALQSAIYEILSFRRR